MEILQKIKAFFYDNPKRGVLIIMGIAFIFFTINMVNLFIRINENNTGQQNPIEEIKEGAGSVKRGMRIPTGVERDRELLKILEEIDRKGEENFTREDSIMVEEIGREIRRSLEEN